MKEEIEQLAQKFGMNFSAGLYNQLENLIRAFPDIVAFLLGQGNISLGDAIALYMQKLKEDKEIKHKRMLKEFQNNYTFDNVVLYLLLAYSFFKSMKKVNAFNEEYEGFSEGFIFQYKESKKFRDIAKNDGFEEPFLQKKEDKKIRTRLDSMTKPK